MKSTRNVRGRRRLITLCAGVCTGTALAGLLFGAAAYGSSVRGGWSTDYSRSWSAPAGFSQPAEAPSVGAVQL
jgi:hypothetical protein